jgi:hypothetical protein
MTSPSRRSSRWCLAPVLLAALLPACFDGADASVAVPDACVGAACARPDGSTRFDAPSLDAPTTDVPSADRSDVPDVATLRDVPVDRPVACAVDAGARCPAGQYCEPTDHVCAPDNGPCVAVDGAVPPCAGDSRCVAGRCLPYGPGETNAACTRPTVPAFLAPGILCSYVDRSPATDPFHGYTSVSPSLVVVDFRFDPSAREPHPSIVAPMHPAATWSTANYKGVLRVLDGRTCEVQQTVDAHLVNGAASAAVGDLDGDGRAEIVASSMPDTRPGVADPTAGGLVAFRFDPATSAWRLLWRSHTAAGAPDATHPRTWASPSIVDLDDDGVPEITLGGAVYDRAGLLLDAHLAPAMAYWQGQFGVTADVDNDARHLPELVTGAGIWSWNTTTRAWVPATFFTPAAPLADGMVAVADFGDFPGTAPGDPEVAVISAGTARVQTIHGAVVFGPVAIPGGGQGGPPTAADFNGDGHVDFAAAARASYLVFDLRCVGTPAPAGCAAPGIRWTRANQDASSHSTGSSVFDFNGDGSAEAVYADECFTRVYDGTSGAVLFSRYRPSCTWYETPIVVDVNGDLKAEIVVPDDDDCGITCGSLAPMGFDSIFPGLRCASAADCPTATMRCDAGLCRCESDAQCGDVGYGCRAPDAASGGAGNVCRALVGTRFGGVQVFGDPRGRWTPSRPVWNEHAYSVTNVSDTGVIPASHLRTPNWRAAGLNHFRQNSQGGLAPSSAADFTVRSARAGECAINLSTGTIELSAVVCNRGTAPVASGVPVAFERTEGDAGTAVACTATTDARLEPGGCATVRCQWAGVAVRPAPYAVTVVPDPARSTLQCLQGNDAFVLPAVSCYSPG